MILLSTVLLAQEPPVGVGIVLRPPVPDVHVLSDGTPVWVIEEHGVPLVRIEVSLRQGYLSVSDPIAALLAGALVGEDELNIGVGAARVWADVEVLKGTESAALASLWSELQTPRLRGRDIRRRRRQLARQRASLVGIPGRIHNTALSEALFPDGHPLAFRPTTMDYRHISPDRVRAVWSELLRAGSPTILVVGDTTPAEILPVLEANLLWLGGVGIPADIPPPDWQGREVVLVDSPGGNRSWITLTLPAPGLSEPDLRAAEVANRVLGGDFTSRLSAVLREEKGFVYDIASTLTSWPGMGRVEITCSVNNDDLIEALEAIGSVVAGMVSTLPDAAEIDAARRAMVLERARAIGSLAGLAGDYGVGQVYGLPPEHEVRRFIDYDALTTEQVAEATAVLFGGEDALWLITGDAAVIEPAMEQAGWTPDRIRAGRAVLP